ncbi:aldo/keto reductase [Deinococcus sp. YIM 134068]|uniref:aldo/keto reductase n=1 Tax=Deinococcus lichenicola TaxID=3118910 RepID=UPI002F95136A
MTPPLFPPADVRLGLGLAALGRPGYLNLGHGVDVGAVKDVDAMRAQAQGVLDAAWEAGVRYYDAARSYGEAEAFLGGWLRERGHRTAVGSKWGYTYTAGWRVDAERHEVKDHTAATLERQWPETLEALGQQPDVYLIHSATLETGVLEDERVLARLAELSQGGVRVGLSTSGPTQAETLRRALAVRVDGVNPLSVVQATWNLLEPSAEEMLAEAHAAGWAVVVKEGVANGRLTSRGTIPPALAEVCADLSATPDAVALAAVLAQPWADVVLSGATTGEQLESNLAALTVNLTPAQLDALRGLTQPAVDYWRERSALTWT